MSASIGYVQTPNIGLYKPVYQADLETWGNHLNRNADTLDAMLAPYPGGVFLPLVGGVMQGALTLAADPVAGPAGALQAATRQYVDAHSGTGGGTGYLPLSGGALTGPLTLAADPAAAMQPVTLQYYNAHVPTATSTAYLAKAGGTMTGTLTLAGNATANLSPVTLQQMNAAVGAYMPISGGHFTGPLTSTTTGSLPSTPENTPNLSFVSGRIISFRQLSNATSPLPTYGGVSVYYNNLASTWPNLSWGGDAGASALAVNANAFPGCNGSTVALQINLTSQGAHAYTSQDVGGSFSVTKLGQNSTWALSTQTQDNTGLAPGSFASIGAELDILANGPDNAASLYDCSLANRYFIYLAAKPNPTTTYASNTHFGVGTIVVQTPSGGVATCYICTTAGTTGATAPTWPTSGNVTDGTVVWKTGTTQASSYSGIFLGATDPTVTINTAFGVKATVANAAIDLSQVTLTDPTGLSAGIRLRDEMAIDFTGNGTQAGKNRRILKYSDYWAGLVYQAPSPAGLVMLLGNDGSATLNGKTMIAGGSTGNIGGITAGYNDACLTIGYNQQRNGNVNFITGHAGLTLFSTDGSGNISTPYVAFASTGISVGANKVIGPQIAGWGTSTGGARGAVAAGTATLPQVAAALAQLLTDLKTHGMLGT